MSVVPGLPGVVPAGDDWIAKKFAELESQIADLRTDRRADYTTVGTGGTFKVDGALVVDGTLEVTGDTALDGALTLVGGATLTAAGDVESANYVAGTSGWKLDGSTGNIEINDATIRGGIIGNDALSDPLETDLDNTGHPFTSDFTGSYATVETCTLTVPSGFTKAFVFATGMARASSSGGTVAVLGKIVVSGHTSAEVVSGAGAGGVAMCPVPYGVQLTGLSAGSLTVNLQVTAGGFLTGTCGTYLTAFAIFLR